MKQERKNIKRIKEKFLSLFAKKSVNDPNQYDGWHLELNDMIIDKTRLCSCEKCRIIFEKQGDACPICGNVLNDR